VPACRSCNLEKGTDDQFLRDLLATDMAARTNPTAKQLFDGPMTRALERNRSEVGRIVASSRMHRIDLRTPAGLYIGEGYQGTLPDDRVSRILTRIVRGLYFSNRKQPLPPEAVTTVFRRSPADLPGFLKTLGTGPELHYEGVFGCKFIFADEKPALTLWLMWFYNSVLYSVETYPSEADRLEYEGRFGPRGPR
jgi:hypothetical protein